MSSLWAVVPAAGSGRRMAADVPKQYLTIAGLTVLEHTVSALLACKDICGVVVVVDASDRHVDTIDIFSDPRVFRAEGGAERVDSVLSGLRAVMTRGRPDDWVLVHDAARPCLPLADLQRLISTVTSTGEGAILAQRCTDTIKCADEQQRITRTLDRSGLWQAQTPQMFRLQELTTALEAALLKSTIVTDEASAMELAGYPVNLVEGPRCNLKVTVPEDLEIARLYLSAATEGVA